MTERELKLALPDEAAWRAVQAVLGSPRERLEQVNVYLDTADGRVAAGRGMLRLRREGAAATLTWKRGVAVRDGYFEAREVECPLTDREWAALEAGGMPEGPLAPLEALWADLGERLPVRPGGRIENLRLRYPLPGGEVLELDRTRFPGGREDFEIEVETARPEEVRALVEDLARRAGVRLAPQARTKYERFLEAAGGR